MLGDGKDLQKSQSASSNDKPPFNPPANPPSNSSNPAYVSELRVKLANLTDANFSDLLAHFGLVTPEDSTPDRDELWGLLSCCSTLAKKYNKREFSNLDILFGVDSCGVNVAVLNIIHREDGTSLYPGEGKLSPCSVCDITVDYGYGDKGQGIECYQCKKWFHNQCLESPLTMGLYGHMIDSPDNVRVFCPKCVDAIDNFKDDLISVTTDVKNCQSTIVGYIQSLSHQFKSALEADKCSKTGDLDTLTASEAVNTLTASVNEACKLVEDLGMTARTNTSTFEGALHTVVEQATRLNNLDLNMLSATITKTAHDVSSKLNASIIGPTTISELSKTCVDAITEKLQSVANITSLSDSKESYAEISGKLDCIIARAGHTSHAHNSGNRSETNAWNTAGKAGRHTHSPSHTMTNSAANKSDGSQAKTSASGRQLEILMDEKKTVSIGNVRDKTISSSARIKSVFNKYYPKIEIIHCKRTVNGFILIELDTLENAEKVVANWVASRFFVDGNGPPTFVDLLQNARAKAIVTDVDNNLTNEEVTTYIRADFPNATARRFVNGRGPTHVVLVSFNSNEDLQKALGSRICIGDVIHRFQVYDVRPRVIQCYNCYQYNHIGRNCNRKMTCPVCTGEHKESDCNVKKNQQTDKFKCTNCQGNHSAVDRSCAVYKKLKIKSGAEVSYE